MKKISPEAFRSSKNKFLFGSTAAVITNLGLIAGIFSSSNAKINIIGSILVIAIADNISDTLGIHIYQEAEGLKPSEVWFSSLTNFISRFAISLVFILMVAILPLELAIVYCMAFGLATLSLISYFIAIYKKRNPYISIFEHLAVATFVIILSRFLSTFFLSRFHL